jgi:hypothetical protein
MAETYDLDRMLKEIEEDAPAEAERTNRRLSQEEINAKLAQRRDGKPEAPSA